MHCDGVMMTGKAARRVDIPGGVYSQVYSQAAVTFDTRGAEVGAASRSHALPLIGVMPGRRERERDRE